MWLAILYQSQNIVKTIEMANLTAGDLQTPEYQTIVVLSDTLCIGIESDLGNIVGRTYSADTISPNERKSILDPLTNQSSNQRAMLFMTIMEN